MTAQEAQVSVVSHEHEEAGRSSILRLPGPLSEWLFSSKFWALFNASTMFDQYEEDEAAVPVIEAVAEALDEQIRALQGGNEPDVESKP
jgi:hypothetical protein